MQRRDVLKMIPLSLAGMTELPAMGQGGRREPASMEAKPLVAQVKQYNGTPTLFLNGEPTFAGMCWVTTPSTEGWRDAENAPAVAKAGIHIYSFDAGKGFEWVEPKAGRTDPFDFSTVESRYGRIIDVDPLAQLHTRLHFEFQPDDWWTKAYRAEWKSPRREDPSASPSPLACGGNKSTITSRPSSLISSGQALSIGLPPFSPAPETLANG